MAAHRRSADQREEDLVKIARLYLQGFTQAAIALQLNLSREQIKYDLVDIRGRWSAAAVQSFDERVAIELAKIDHLETTYWEGWVRSLQPHERSTTERTTGSLQRGPVNGQPLSQDRAQLQKEGRDGNPRFLEGVERCIDRRIKLFGLNPPERQVHTGPDGGPIQVQDVPDERILAAERAFMAALRGGAGEEPAPVVVIEGDYRASDPGDHAL